MLKFKLKVREKCNKHPRYDPEKDGEAGIKGGCERCTVLYKIFRQLDAARAIFEGGK
jgi:hypothetical protein